MARVKSSPNYCLRFVIRNQSCSDHELEVSYTDEDDDDDVIDDNHNDDNSTYNCNTQKNVNQGIDNGGVGNNDNIDDDGSDKNDDEDVNDDDDVNDDEDASSRNIFLKGCRSKSRKKKTFSFASK